MIVEERVGVFGHEEEKVFGATITFVMTIT